jgi:hypothetical protein
VPEELVGMWTAGDDAAAELMYAFGADGTYHHIGVLLQEREGGTFSFTVEERGALSVDGDSMVLQPETGSREVRNPDVPGGDSERPVDKTPRRYSWALDKSTSPPTLQLTDVDGSTVDYTKQ